MRFCSPGWPPPEPGLRDLTRLDHLPGLRETAEVGAITSYDRTGNNDDGFSGTYSFVRKEGGARSSQNL